MPIPLTLARHLKDQVLIATWDGTFDAAGNHGYAGGDKAAQCKIDQETKHVTSHEGHDVVSNTQVILREVYADGTPLSSLTPSDRITLPAGYLPQQPPIQRIDRLTHDFGLYGWKVWL